MSATAKQFVLLGGMPRAGSTLLCNILAQNPSLHATATSGCMDVMFGIRNSWDKLIEHRSNPDRAGNKRALRRVLRAVMDAYYAEAAKPVIVEKCRGWLSLLEMADAVLGYPVKVIVPIRNVADVLSSFEKLHRRQSALGQTPGEAESHDTVHQYQCRADAAHQGIAAGQPVPEAAERGEQPVAANAALVRLAVDVRLAEPAGVRPADGPERLRHRSRRHVQAARRLLRHGAGVHRHSAPVAGAGGLVVHGQRRRHGDGQRAGGEQRPGLGAAAGSSKPWHTAK
jgi:Sulfotransferase family